MARTEIKRIAVLILGLVILGGVGHAQKQKDNAYRTERSRAGISISGGLGKVLVVPHQEVSMGITYGFDLNYTYLLSQHFGFKAGVGMSQTKSNLAAENLISTPSKLTTITTTAGTEQVMAQYQCITPNANEYYSLTYAEVPLMILFQGTPLGITKEHFHKCYVALGAKLAIPLSTKAKTDYSKTNVYVWPTVPGSGITLDEPMRMGDYMPTNEEYDMKTAGNMMYVMAALEAGVLFTINDIGTIQAALFVDYAINHSTTNNPADASAIAAKDGDFYTVGYLHSNNVSMFKFFRVGAKLQYNIKW